MLAAPLTFLIGTAVDIFYRRRVLPGGGDVPPTGPLLVVANHPNGLLDPIVVQNAFGKIAGRRLRPLAKAPLFKMPFVSILIKGMEALPVYRSRDGADTRQNDETFRAVEQALVEGSAVLIFPEGISHDEPSVQPLKTGAARMALRAYQQGASQIVIVPVGLSYADKLRFRSTAAVEIGQPIRVADFANGDDQRAAVKDLTAAIFEGLHRVTVNLESWEDLPILEAVDAIWRLDDPERVRRLKSLAAGTRQIRDKDPARYDDLRTRLSDWLLRLKRVGLRPQDLAEGAVQARRNPIKMAQFALRNLFALIFALPFALFGAVFWSAPFWSVHLIWMLWRAERDVGATVKVLASLVLFPLWYLAVLALSWKLLPLKLWVLLAAVAPTAGMMTRHFFRRRFHALEQLATFLQLGMRGQLRNSLLRERDAFCQEFDELARLVSGTEGG